MAMWLSLSEKKKKKWEEVIVALLGPVIRIYHMILCPLSFPDSWPYTKFPAKESKAERDGGSTRSKDPWSLRDDTEDHLLTSDTFIGL